MDSPHPPSSVNLEGSLTIERAFFLKTELEAALSASGNVLVGLTQVDDLDLACLQILYSARRTARAAGKELHLAGSVQSRIVRRLTACGFLHGSPESADELETVLADF